MLNRQLKILFILTPALHPNEGGVQVSTLKLGACFRELGHSVSVFSFARTGHLCGDKVALLHSEYEGGGREVRNLRKLSSTIDQLRPDVVINQMPYEHKISSVLRRAKEAVGFFLVACLRNTLFSVKENIEAYVSRVAPWPLKYAARSKLLQQQFLRRHVRRHRSDLLSILETYDRFIMFGPPNLAELRYFVPEFDPQKVALIPNSVPRVLDAVPRKEKRLLWLGRVAHEQKQAELVIPIWQAAASRLPEWQFDVVGDGPLLPELRAHAHALGLERIHFHGRQEPDGFFSRSAIFVMTSSFEGFPNALVEAQSFAAIPVIFDSYPVASWIVDDGRNGYLLPAFNLEAMIDRIVKLAVDQEREQISRQVLDSARRFTIDKVGELWQELFCQEVPRHVSSGRIGT